MAAQNEASIWVSSAPKAARNTPRSRCSRHTTAVFRSFDQYFRLVYCLKSFRGTIRKMQGFSFSESQYGTTSIDPVRQSAIPSSIRLCFIFQKSA